MRKVYFAMPKERHLMSEAVVCWEEILFYLGSQPTEGIEYVLLSVGYQSVDSARNYLAFKFMEKAVSDDDTLVMLDNDHLHPKDIVEKLALHNKPVVGALAFKRKAPFQPVAYVRDPKDHQLKIPIELPDVLCKVHRIGGAALAIQKQAFDKITKHNFAWPWFRFTYKDWDQFHGGEDIYFMDACEKSGVPIFCDFGLRTPHLDTLGRDESDWNNWLNAPTREWNGYNIESELIQTVPERYIRG